MYSHQISISHKVYSFWSESKLLQDKSQTSPIHMPLCFGAAPSYFPVSIELLATLLHVQQEPWNSHSQFSGFLVILSSDKFQFTFVLSLLFLIQIHLTRPPFLICHQASKGRLKVALMLTGKYRHFECNIFKRSHPSLCGLATQMWSSRDVTSQFWHQPSVWLHLGCGSMMVYLSTTNSIK